MRRYIKHIKKDFIHDVLVYVFSIIFIVLLSTTVKVIPDNISLINKNKADDTPKMEIPSYDLTFFDNLSIDAKAYVVYDILNDKVIYGYNENEKLPLASLTKLMMALTSVSLGSPDTVINIEKRYLDGGYDLGLKKNQLWRLDELLKYTLVFSSNDGALSIANEMGGESNFINLMNQKAVELNLDLTFSNPAGLDDGNDLGGLGSAYQVAKLIGIANKTIPNILDSTTHKNVNLIASSGQVNGIPNINQNVNDIVGLISSKTGFTNLAGGNLAITFDISLGHPIAIVVLNSTREGRFSDTYKLYQATREALK